MAQALDELIDAGVKGRRILVRSDLNVPLDGQQVTDDGRIRASLPVLEKLTGAGARVIVTAHLGRPKGEHNPKYSLKPAADRLRELADFPVQLAEDVVGDDARAKAEALSDGEVLVVENVRFDPRETSKDDAEREAFADELVALTGQDGAYVDDAFGAVHRKHASVYDVARKLPAYLGDLVKTELEVLKRITEDPQRPFVVVMGGAKVSDKLAVIENLIGKADALLIGGGMSYTFAAAQGHAVDDHVDIVLDVFFQLRHFVQLIDLAVHAHPRKTLRLQVGKEIDKLTLTLAHRRRQNHHARVFRQFQYGIDHLRHGLAG